MSPALQLAVAHLRHHRGKAVVLSAIFFILVFLPLFVLSTVELLQDQLKARAKQTPLLLGPAQGQVETVLHHLHFQWEGDPPSFTPSEAFGLFDERPMEAIPLVLMYDILDKTGANRAPLLGTTAQYLDFRKLSLSKGRPPGQAGEVVIGAGLARKWQVRPGDFLKTAPHRLLDLSKAHQLDLEVVGILGSSGGPDDQLAITLAETTWIKMGLGHGHQEVHLDGVPKSLHLSIHSEQEGYRRFGTDNRAHLHFHQPSSLLPLTGMILIPSSEEERLFALAWGMNHPGLDVVDPLSVTQRILGSLHRLGDILLFLLAVVSLTTLILMGLLLRMNFIMRRRDGEVLEELGIPASTFMVANLVEWFFYLSVGTALAILAGLLLRLEIFPWLELLTLIGN